MTERIYFLNKEDRLVSLTETQYESEGRLQQLLAAHPELMAGDQIDPSDPRRWLLIEREIGVPGDEGAAGRWSLDHLFLDQDAVPTLVEVKRSSDTRVRREVVGQMLDYAANGVAYWTLDQIMDSFRLTCGKMELDPQERLAQFLGSSDAADDFWERVKTNLQAGKVRLVFVADNLPQELRRIIEFLNEQTDPMEVLGVEVRQFVGGDATTLVPRVIGQTTEAQVRKGRPRASRSWDEMSFFKDLTDRHGEDAAKVAREIFDWGKGQGLRIAYGKGAVTGSFFPMLDMDGESYYTVSVQTAGRIEIPFQYIGDRGPFADPDRREELRRRFNTVEGVDIPVEGIDKFPSVQLEGLVANDSTSAFLQTLDWYLECVRASE